MSDFIERPKRIEDNDPAFPKMVQRTRNQFLIWAGLSIAGIFLLGALGFVVAVLAMAWVLMQMLLMLYQRQQVENFQHYRQLEALASLHALIDIRQPLPPLRLWAISPDFALQIISLIRLHKPQTVVELGSGSSTLVTAYALEAEGDGGKVYSFDHLEKFVESSRKTITKHGLAEYSTITHAPLQDITVDDESLRWYARDKFDSLGTIDLLIVDGPPAETGALARYPAIPVLIDKLKVGGVVLVDDVGRTDDTNVVNRWLDDYDLEVIEVIANEKGAAILRKKDSAAPQSVADVIADSETASSEVDEDD